MKSLYDFIIQPVGDRYANEIKIEDSSLVLNTKIETFQFVNRLAKVIETPIAFTTPINKGDIIVVHQNIFRRFYDMQGKPKNSRSYFKDNMLMKFKNINLAKKIKNYILDITNSELDGNYLRFSPKISL